jgi:hypothetical protein
MSCIAQAQASGWKISSFRDRMNDRDIKYAELAAKAPDHGLNAKLGLTCSKEMGGRYFTLTLSNRIVGSRVGGSYRVDNEPEEMRFFSVFDGRIGLIEAPPFDLITRKRFRVQLQIPRQPAHFYDFDLSDLPATAKAIGCG